MLTKLPLANANLEWIANCDGGVSGEPFPLPIVPPRLVAATGELLGAEIKVPTPTSADWRK